MKAVKIKLESIDDIKKLNKIASEQPFDTDIVSGRYVIDAKSIMGLFSIDLSKTVVLQMHEDDKACSGLIESLSEFIV